MTASLCAYRRPSTSVEWQLQTVNVVLRHGRLLLDIVSMKIFVSLFGHNGELLDSHLFFFDRYSDLADYHRHRGQVAKADTFAVIAEEYFRAAPDDDEPTEGAAMAMPVPQPLTHVNAVGTARVKKPSRERSHLVPSPTG
jgi:hypothetical protein